MVVYASTTVIDGFTLSQFQGIPVRDEQLLAHPSLCRLIGRQTLRPPSYLGGRTPVHPRKDPCRILSLRGVGIGSHCHVVLAVIRLPSGSPTPELSLSMRPPVLLFYFYAAELNRPTDRRDGGQ